MQTHNNWISGSIQSYERFVNAQNNIKQRNLTTVFSNISKTTSPTSDSFLLIMSHISEQNVHGMRFPHFPFLPGMTTCTSHCFTSIFNCFSPQIFPETSWFLQANQQAVLCYRAWFESHQTTRDPAVFRHLLSTHWLSTGMWRGGWCHVMRLRNPCDCLFVFVFFLTWFCERQQTLISIFCMFR